MRTNYGCWHYKCLRVVNEMCSKENKQVFKILDSDVYNQYFLCYVATKEIACSPSWDNYYACTILEFRDIIRINIFITFRWLIKLKLKLIFRWWMKSFANLLGQQAVHLESTYTGKVFLSKWVSRNFLFPILSYRLCVLGINWCGLYSKRLAQTFVDKQKQDGSCSDSLQLALKLQCWVL